MKFGHIARFACLSAALLFASAQAQSRGVKYEEPWGMAGCGFSSLFIKEKSQGAQIGASVVNMFFSEMTNSSAMSSGTSNCVTTRTRMASNEQKVFITVNLASLTKEAAQGNGEHIAALAEVFGCPHAEFAKLSQSHYTRIYGKNEPDAVYNNYVTEVTSDQNLVKSCLRVI